MEYIRKRLLSDELHFGSVKNHKSLHIPKDVGPFQIRSQSVVHYLEGFLEHLSLEKAKEISYDPYGVLSKQRKENKNVAYEPIPRPDLVSIANKHRWKENE